MNRPLGFVPSRIFQSLGLLVLTCSLLWPALGQAAQRAKTSPGKASVAKSALAKAPVRGKPAVSKGVASKVTASRLTTGKAAQARAVQGRFVSAKQAHGRALPTKLALRHGAHRARFVSYAPVMVPAKPSFGELAGLRGAQDPLDLKSSVALVVDQDTQEVLFRKNDKAVLPIASLTKLMTGLLISEARLPMDELITISQDDVDTEKGSRSRLTVGASLTRGELLHLALMSSENRAAHALGRTYPGGLDQFVGLMNQKAQQLGMRDTRYEEPTGLSSRNQSSAQDLATLVRASYRDPLVRELSTSPEYQVEVGSRTLHYNNTNRLVKNPSWDIGLQKTGYISEAGQCLVMQAKIAGRKLIMVFLDSAGKLSRLGDAERVRRWVEATSPMAATSVGRPFGGE